MNPILEVKSLCKQYSDKKVVNDLSFQVKKGEILCLLGPNGAGKSTSINIICSLIDFNQGEILWKGKGIYKQLNHFKSILGVVPQDLALYEDLSALKNVRFFASLYGLKGKELDQKTQTALEFVGLWSRRNDKTNTFSGGMKRRLNIACAITHNPELLIMDEPTVGIDPQSRNHILDSIKLLKEKGMTIIYTTHYMEEVEEISDRILIMDEGNIIAEGTSESLKEELLDVHEFIVEVEDVSNVVCDDFYQIDGVKSVIIDNQKIIVTCIKNMKNIDQIINQVFKQNLKILNLSNQGYSLENAFLKLTGKSLRD